jgi:hypothetical protein
MGFSRPEPISGLMDDQKEEKDQTARKNKKCNRVSEKKEN